MVETLPVHNFPAVLRPDKIDHQGYSLWCQSHCWRMEYKCCSPRGLCSKFYKHLQPWSIYMASGPWQCRMVYTLHFCTFLYKYCINYISKSDYQVLMIETLFGDIFQRSQWCCLFWQSWDHRTERFTSEIKFTLWKRSSNGVIFHIDKLNKVAKRR